MQCPAQSPANTMSATGYEGYGVIEVHLSALKWEKLE